MKRAAVLWVLLLATAAFGDDGAFRRAEMQERGLGDLRKAATLYLEAARDAEDGARRVEAEIRAASCLRRLGEKDRAIEILSRVTADETVPAELKLAAERELGRAEGKETPPGAAAAAEKSGTLEVVRADLEQTRLQLETALTRAESSEKDLAALARRLQEKDRELDTLREKLPPPEPTSAEEVLKLRRAELERERREAKAASRVYTGTARRLHRAGEFTDARDFLYAALEKDPENVEAKALLARVSAPLGDRERLHQEILAVLALAREVRAARLTAEVRDLVREARNLQQRGDHAGSVIPLEHASSLLEASAAEIRAPEDVSRQVTDLLRAAEAAGASRAPIRLPSRAPDVAEWMPALRALLASAGSEVSAGLRMRFLDLDGALSAAAGSLPPSPVGAAPRGWKLSGDTVPPADLLVAFLRASERKAFRAPGASLTSVGRTAVILADEAAQRRLFDRVTGMGLAGAVSIDVGVTLYRGDAGRAGSLLRTRGLALHEGADGTRSVVVPAADLRAVEEELAGDGRRITARATLRATPLRAFRLRTDGTAPLRLEILPVPGDVSGAAVRFATAWKPKGRPDTATVGQDAVAAAELPAGAGLIVYGLVDPEAPRGDLVAVVRVGSNLVGSDAPLPPSRPDQPKPPEQRSGQLRLPDELLGLEETPPAFTVRGAPLPSRREAILARLRGRARGATLVDLQDGRVLVVGPEAAHEGAQSLVDDLSRIAGVQRYEVRMHEVTSATEKRVLRSLTGWNAVADAAFAWVVVDSDSQQKGLNQLLEGSAREIPLVEPRPAAPPTARADVARVVRSLLGRGIDTTSGPQPSWGRAERVWVDEGVLVSLRSFGAGRGHRGRVPLDVSVRASRIRETRTGELRTPLGTVPVVQPAAATLAGDISTSLAAGDVLVLAAMANPFGRGNDRSHLVVQIRVLR